MTPRFKNEMLLVAAILTATLASCQGRGRPVDPAQSRNAIAERQKNRQIEMETLVTDVEAWIVRASTDAQPGEREKVDRLALGLRQRLAPVKSALKNADGSSDFDAALEREAMDLRNAYERAIASISSERRTAEAAMDEALKLTADQLAEFRVEVASCNVSGNAEVKQRISQLELGRREALETLSELKRSGVDRWPPLHRRWDSQMRRWNRNHDQAVERLALIFPPATPTPARTTENK